MIDNAKVISGPKSWIEGAALAQLERTATRPGIVFAWGMADLHPGMSCPIGAVFMAEGRIFPDLIGSDIGCGMGWWRLSNKLQKPDKIAKKIKSLERGVDNPDFWLDEVGCKPCGFEHSLGTIGRGNHFAEFLVPDGILDPEAYSRITEDAPAIMLVHSGSRGYGEKILYDHTKIYQDEGLLAGTDEFNAYMRLHQHAFVWAVVNRAVIGERLLKMTGLTGKFISDVTHNFVQGVVTREPITGNKVTWIHRKGAIPADQGPIIIPGSRGAHSYLVEPLPQTGIEASGYSLSHGAGRKMSRRDARVKFNAERDSIKTLQRTKFGSIVICEDRELLMEEAPQTYKDIDRVIQDQIDHDLIRVVAMLKPVITYKYRREADDAHTQC
jgi:release factor H-coupled RctB family protein